MGDCVSDTTQIDISIVPNPNAEISSNPNPIVVNLPVTFSDASITYVNQISSWEWEINEIWTLWFISNSVPGSYPEEAIFDGKPVINYDPNNSAMSYDWGVNGNFLSFVKTQLFLKLSKHVISKQHF